jgi:hypothetical protein
MEGIAAARHEALLAQLARLEYKVDSNQEAVSQKLDLNRRVERIELAQFEESARRSGGSSSRHRSRSAGRSISTDRPSAPSTNPE